MFRLITQCLFITRSTVVSWLQQIQTGSAAEIAATPPNGMNCGRLVCQKDTRTRPVGGDLRQVYFEKKIQCQCGKRTRCADSQCPSWRAMTFLNSSNVAALIACLSTLICDHVTGLRPLPLTFVRKWFCQLHVRREHFH